MDQPTVTPHQVGTEHQRRLVEAVRGLSACRFYYAFKMGGVAGLEAEIRKRDEAKEHDATNSQTNH